MTQPVQEPTQGRSDQAQEFRTRQLFRRPAQTGPVWVNYEIKLFSDTTPATIGDGAFFFPVPADLNGLHLVAGAAGVSTVGASGTMEIQVQNIGDETTPLTDDMFSTPITIDATKNTSYHSATQPVVDTGNDQVFTGQTLRVDIDDIPASGGFGLAIVLSFDSVPGGTGAIGPPGPQGPQGDPGSGFVATDSIWDTKGDIAVATGADAAVVVPVGTDGQVLVADSGETAGVKWDTPGASSSDGWADGTATTWTYASGSGGGTATFTITGSDQTAVFTPGTRVRLKQGGGYKYFVVGSSSFGGGNTTVTITAGTDFTLANASITDNYYSYELNPQGYPGWFTFAPSLVGWSSATPDFAQFAVVGRQCFLSVSKESASNATTVTFTVPIAATTTSVPFALGICKDNSGAYAVGRGYLNTTTQFKCGPTTATDTWTASGTKGIAFDCYYHI